MAGSSVGGQMDKYQYKNLHYSYSYSDCKGKTLSYFLNWLVNSLIVHRFLYGIYV